MTTTITIDDELLTDMKLVKRVLGTKNMTETIRNLLDARGYNKEWLEYMTKVLEQEKGLGA
jgi:hypothetical protein